MRVREGFLQEMMSRDDPEGAENRQGGRYRYRGGEEGNGSQTQEQSEQRHEGMIKMSVFRRLSVVESESHVKCQSSGPK